MSIEIFNFLFDNMWIAFILIMIAISAILYSVIQWIACLEKTKTQINYEKCTIEEVPVTHKTAKRISCGISLIIGVFLFITMFNFFNKRIDIKWQYAKEHNYTYYEAFSSFRIYPISYEKAAQDKDFYDVIFDDDKKVVIINHIRKNNHVVNDVLDGLS